MTWTMEQEEWLRNHYGKKSASCIKTDFNKHFGTQKTRNAIIGKAQRMGMFVPKPKAKEIKIVALNNRLEKKVKDKYIEPICFNESYDGVSLLDLGLKQCHWPIKPHHYCGKDADYDGYCEYHNYLRYKGYERTIEAVRRGEIIHPNRDGNRSEPESSGGVNQSSSSSSRTALQTSTKKTFKSKSSKSVKIVKSSPSMRAKRK